MSIEKMKVRWREVGGVATVAKVLFLAGAGTVLDMAARSHLKLVRDVPNAENKKIQEEGIEAAKRNGKIESDRTPGETPIRTERRRKGLLDPHDMRTHRG